MPLFKYDGSAAAETKAPSTNFYGTSGTDTLTGTAAAEAFFGGEGDRLVGGAGDDTYFLKSHKDVVVELAGGGVDKIVAWHNVSLADHPHVENLNVSADRSYAAGNALDNIVSGGAGSQQLYGGHGQDILIGGAGADVFIVIKGEGNDVIQDFSPAEDVVRLKAGFWSFSQVQARLVQVGSDVRLDLGDGDGLMFRNLSVGQLTAANFQLQLDPARLGALTFSDEFSGPLSIWDKESNPNGVWRPDYGYQGSQGYGSYTLAGNGEKQIYTSPYFRDHPGTFAESPFVSNPDGTLSIWARPSTNPEIFGYGYTSGLITTRQSFSQTYGYFEMRAAVPKAGGTWPAFWLLPKDWSWPPELDVMEVLGHDPRATWTTQHSNATGSHSSKGAAIFTPDSGDGYHTYGVLWSPTELIWYIDGVEAFRTATPADMHKPMFMLANLALGGWAGTVNAAALPAEFKIDYIRAYALGTGASEAPIQGARLVSGATNDTLQGGAGQDYIRGGEGDDSISGGDSFDDLHGNQGNDTISGGRGDDWVVGGKDNDLLYGDDGNDIILGNLGADTCYGGAGADTIRGGQANDVLFGGDGNDWLSGDRGDDTITGGAGADTFHSFAGAGLDRILDFNAAEGDRLQLLPGQAWSVSQVGADTVVNLGGLDRVVLVGVQLSTLPEGWIFGF